MTDDQFDLRDSLIEKSIEAYVLALETINRLTVQYRFEAFCYLLCNAWELLLKAKIITDSGDEKSIFYKNQVQKSYTLKSCLIKVINNENDPIRKNIEYVEKMRNKATHLVIGRIPQDVILLFQAGVINYHKLLNKWFGKSLSDQYPVGMMSIVFDRSPEQDDLTDNRLQKHLGPHAATFLSKYCADIRREFEQLNNNTSFKIPIEYRFVLTNREDDADISLSSGPSDKDPTTIVQIPKDPSTSHPYRQTDIVHELEKEYANINKYDIQCINDVYNIKNNHEYFYQGKVKGSPGQYSQAFLDWIRKKAEHDSEFFMKTREAKKAKNK